MAPGCARGRRLDRDTGEPAHLPLQARHDPPDLRVRGRLAGPGHRHRSTPPTSSSPRRSAASTSASPSSPRRWTRSSTCGCRASWPASVGSRCSTSRASRRATTTRPRSSSGSRPRPTTPSRTCSPRPTLPPIREELIARRIDELHAAGSKAAVSATPGVARRFGPFCAEHGADLFLVQSQVSSARHLATGYEPLALEDFTRFMPIPVAVGNTTNAQAAYMLMEQGAAAIFVGVGPGRRLHDPRGAGHRHPAGHRHRGRGRGSRPVPRRDGHATCRSSPTAA